MIDARRLARQLAGGAGDQVDRRVVGHLVDTYGSAASNVSIRAYHRGFGGKGTLLAEGSTDERGACTLDYSAPAPVNLELRVVDGEGRETALSLTKFGAAPQEQLDLVVPAVVRPLASEYQRLSADVTRGLGDAALLRDARESGGRDLSVAFQATAWEARLLGLAATAMANAARIKVPAEALYGLYRLGLPADPAALAALGFEAIDAALTQAVRVALVAGEDGRLDDARRALGEFVRRQQREVPIRGTLSAFADLLAATGLPPDQQDAFEQVYLSSPADLWAAVGDRLPAEAVNQLRLHGRLAALTLNHAPLVALIRDRLGDAGPAGLVDVGFDDPDAVGDDAAPACRESRSRSGRSRPPPRTSGPTWTRGSKVTPGTSRKVRLTFPTRVVADLLEKGQISGVRLGPDGGRGRAEARQIGLDQGGGPCGDP